MNNLGDCYKIKIFDCLKVFNGIMTSDQVHESPDNGHSSMDQMEGSEEERRSRVNVKKKNSTSGAMGRKKMTKDERDRLMEEKKLKKLVSLYSWSNIIVYIIQREVCEKYP